MRKICEFEEEKPALRFWNYLKENKIVASLEKDEGAWILWVEAEESVLFASSAFKEFQLKPDDPKFLSSTPDRRPDDSEEIEEPLFQKSRYKEHKLRNHWVGRNAGLGSVTFALIIVATCVYLPSLFSSLFGNLGLPVEVFDSLNEKIRSGFLISKSNEGSELLSGQIWRIVTPIFLHFGFFHILFNMFWLFSLGGQIESRKGGKFFLSFVLILATVSNLVQFLFSGYNFGGMSGVVYGLFGYVFIKSKLDPGDGFGIDQTNEIIMFGFFVACWLGWLGNIANWAHTGGLVVGLLWGWCSALRWNRGRR
ncbi:MAG: rhomboid family intramembrane serine protease [Opitutae bacterium]